MSWKRNRNYVRDWLRARQSEAVFYSPELDYWVVTRYEDIKEQCPQMENGG